VAEGFEHIYTSSKLKPPTALATDSGTEFKGKVTTMMDRLGVKQRFAEKGRHRSQAFVESFNKQLAKRLFALQDLDEFHEHKQSSKWLKRLPEVVQAMNKQTTRLIGMPPNKAIERKEVEQPKSDVRLIKAAKKEPPLPFNAQVRVKLGPEDQKDGKQRATDPTFSRQVYQVVKRVKGESTPPLYFVEGKKHGYLRSQLQVVRGEPQPPPPAPAPKPVKAVKRKVANPPPLPQEQRQAVWATRRGRFVRAPQRLR
jgi:hypothetical protein